MIVCILQIVISLHIKNGGEHVPLGELLRYRMIHQLRMFTSDFFGPFGRLEVAFALNRVWFCIGTVSKVRGLARR